MRNDMTVAGPWDGNEKEAVLVKVGGYGKILDEGVHYYAEIAG